MKSTASAALVLTFLAGAGLAWAQDVRVIVGFNGDPDPAVFARHGGRAGKGLRSANAVAGVLPPGGVGTARLEPNVAYIEEDRVVSTLAQTTAWGVTRVGAPAAWSSGNTGAGVKVAVIDTGVDLDHPDLAANVIAGVNVLDPTKSPDDDNGHGSHVAGIVGAVNNTIGVVGVAPGCKLIPVKVLNAAGLGSTSDIIDGIEQAVSLGAQVLNLSLGSRSPNAAEEAAVDAAVNANRLVVAAAGNDGDGIANDEDPPSYPGAYGNAMGVGSTNQNDSLSSFSTTGAFVDISGPGGSIYSTYKAGKYKTLSGTSMATPHVAGAAALAWASGTTTVAQVRALLEGTAEDLGPSGRDNGFGEGLVDAEAAAAGSIPPAVNVAVSTDKAAYSSETDSAAAVTVVVTDENGNPISGLSAGAFVSTVDGSPASLSFSETTTPGTYGASLGLSGLSAGSHTLQVTVTDGRPVTGVGAATFSLDASALVAKVQSIGYSTVVRGNRKDLIITITVVNQAQNALNEATVNVQVTWPNGGTGTGSGTTDTSGVVKFRVSNVQVGDTFTTLVTNVLKSGYAFDPNDPANSYTGQVPLP
jgi:minor extracellular protease Epr